MNDVLSSMVFNFTCNSCDFFYNILLTHVTQYYQNVVILACPVIPACPESEKHTGNTDSGLITFAGMTFMRNVSY